MSTIFVSYRQKDTLMHAGRIADTFVARFGTSHVFQDRAILHGGSNWQEALENAMNDCAVLVAVIGPNWFDQTSGGEERRIDDPDDYVRMEVVTALNRGIPVIPVLVAGARRLHEKELPESLKKLAYIEPLTIIDDAWHAGINDLLDAIRQFNIRPNRIGWKIVASLVLCSVGTIALMINDPIPRPAAFIGLVSCMFALALSIRAYYENRKGAQSGRNWAVGVMIYSGLIALALLDELIPDKYF